MASLLEELGAKVTTEIATITRLLQANGEGSPSFAESSAVDVNASQTTSKDQASLLAARNELVNAAQDVLRLAQGPIDHVVTLAYAVRCIASCSFNSIKANDYAERRYRQPECHRPFPNPPEGAVPLDHFPPGLSNCQWPL